MEVLGQWFVDEVGDMKPPSLAKLAITLSGRIEWRNGLEEVRDVKAIFPEGAIVRDIHVDILGNRASATFHINRLDPLENLVCALVGKGLWVGDDDYDDDVDMRGFYLSDDLVREGFKINRLQNFPLLLPGPLPGPLPDPLPDPLPLLPHPPNFGIEENHLVPWHPDLPSCFELTNHHGFHRSVVPPDAWHRFPPDANLMRDRFIYETFLIRDPFDPRTFLLDNMLPPMSLRLLNVITPGEWALIIDGHVMAHHKADIDLLEDVPDELVDQNAHHELVAHAINGISSGSYEIKLRWLGEPDDCPQGARIFAEGTRILARDKDRPELGVGYRFISSPRLETERRIHFPAPEGNLEGLII